MATLNPEEFKKQQQNEQEFKEFSNNLHKLIKGNKEISKQALIIGKTPNSLVICNANKELNLVIQKRVVDKCMRTELRSEDGKSLPGSGHGLSEIQLLEAIDSIKNPVMILRGSAENSLVTITNLKDKKNREIIVAINLNQKGFSAEVNKNPF